jgi:hypothetical protein
LQGARVTQLSNSLEPPEGWRESFKPANKLLQAIHSSQPLFEIASFFLFYILGIVALIRGEGGKLLRQRLPILSAACTMAGFYLVWLFWPDTPATASSPEKLLGGMVMSGFFGISFFPSFAGWFGCLQSWTPRRLHGAEQLVRGRAFSRAAAASLVNGSLAGALIATLPIGIAAIIARLPGYVPSIPDLVRQVQGGGPMASQEFTALVFSAFEIFFIAVILELRKGRSARASLRYWLRFFSSPSCATGPVTARIAGL